MFTPQKLGWPGWSPKSAEKKEKGKVPASAEARSEAVSPVKGLIDRAMTTTTSASTLEDNGEPEIWRRFREVGALDEAAIDMKDKASFMAHLSTLESELRASVVVRTCKGSGDLTVVSSDQNRKAFLAHMPSEIVDRRYH